MIPSHSLRLDGVRQRLERWRRTRRHPRAPMPAPIWTDAVGLARQHGLSQTARALRLDYTALKRHVEAIDVGGRTVVPAFVELPAPLQASPWVIELIGPRATVRLRVPGLGVADLATLTQRLAGTEP